MTASQKERLIALSIDYKENIYAKLLELLPERIEGMPDERLDGRSVNEVLEMMYVQGMAEALDAFDVAELLRAFEGEDQPGGLEA